MNARNSAARFALFASLGSAAILIVAGAMAPGLKAEAAPDPPAKTITDFVNCVNTNLMAKNNNPKINNGSVSIADTVACVPPKCSVIVTMSLRSDQPALAFDILAPANSTVQFPRVVFSCPGSKAGLQLRPSYSLGFDKAQYKKLEIAEDVKAGEMMMANIPISGAKRTNYPRGEIHEDSGQYGKEPAHRQS